MIPAPSESMIVEESWNRRRQRNRRPSGPYLWWRTPKLPDDVEEQRRLKEYEVM